MRISATATSSLSAALLSFFLFLFGTFFLTDTASAQWNVPTARPLELKVSPAYPRPNSIVKVDINAYSTDTSGARITWYIDGVEYPSGRDKRSITLESKGIGRETTVRADIAPARAGAFSLRTSIVPAAVDIIIEADTYVPSFYRGRALPSKESRVRVTAIPLLGRTVDPRTLIYRWEQNGGVLFGGAARGLQSVTLTVPRYMGKGARVIISDSTGKTLAETLIALDANPMELLYYEENPLRGLSELAVRDNLSLIGEETTIHAEPYFMNVDDGFSNMAFEWEINGSDTQGNTDPHTITLRRTGGAGTASIRTSAYTTDSLPSPVDGHFMINF